MCACDFSALGGQKRELQVVVSPLVCILGTKLRSSIRAVSAVPSLQPLAVLIHYLFFHHKQFPSLHDRQFYTVSSSEHSLPLLADVFFVFLFLSAGTKFPILK